MSRLKIAVYTMAKNESQHVQRFGDTTVDADVVVVTDTGSTDGTPDLLRDRGIQVHSASILPWRFDTATNVALAHVPADVDICIKLDLDEVLWHPSGDWRSEIERQWTAGCGQLRYWYTWSWQIRGEVPAIRFRTANIHARSGFIWRHAGHAGLFSQCRTPIRELQETEIHHYMTGKSRPDYLSLLQLAVFENKCPRTLFYLGREYFFRKIDTNAINTLEEYLAHPAACWKAERAEAMRILGTCHDRLKQPSQALARLLQATAEYPRPVRELWFAILEHFHRHGDWEGGVWAGQKCLGITARDPEYQGSGVAWSAEPYALLHDCATNAARPDLLAKFPLPTSP